MCGPLMFPHSPGAVLSARERHHQPGSGTQQWPLTLLCRFAATHSSKSFALLRSHDNEPCSTLCLSASQRFVSFFSFLSMYDPPACTSLCFFCLFFFYHSVVSLHLLCTHMYFHFVGSLLSMSPCICSPITVWSLLYSTHSTLVKVYLPMSHST